MAEPLSPIGIAVLALLSGKLRHPYEMYGTMIAPKRI